MAPTVPGEIVLLELDGVNEYMVQKDGFLAGADALARQIPGATRVDVEQAGHHPHRENEEAWLDAVSAHLARTADRG